MGICIIVQNTNKKKDWHQVNAVKDLQTLLLATGTSPTLALVTNISTQALFQQFEKPDWLNVIHANGAK